ncbi:hypothetical protein H9P43_000527 [Blastocladiella emersonii ATCC 22665]|nr:hypothetical protein H9P43_000527 [Blastocladiella emersonii ATCC 22665]
MYRSMLHASGLTARNALAGVLRAEAAAPVTRHRAAAAVLHRAAFSLLAPRLDAHNNKHVCTDPTHHHHGHHRPAESVAASAETTVSGEAEVTLPDGGGKFLLAFTCKMCNTRVSKLVSHHSYTKGVVLIRCDGCEKLHLIADNKGWFQDGKNVEEILREQQPEEHVRKVSIRAKDPQSQAFLEKMLESDPALLERLARAQMEAAARAKDGNASPATIKMTLPAPSSE